VKRLSALVQKRSLDNSISKLPLLLSSSALNRRGLMPFERSYAKTS